MMIDGPMRVLRQSMSANDAFDRTYGVFYILALPAFLAALFAYVRVWFPTEPALVGVLFVAATLPVAMRPHEYGPHSFLEPTFFSLSLLCIVRERRLWLALLVAIAAMNRETGVFLILFYAVARPLNTQRLMTTLAMAASSAGSSACDTRVMAGATGRLTKSSAATPQPWLAVFNVAVLLGKFWWFAAAGFRRAPPFVQRVASVIPAYVAVIAVWGIWWEVRLLLPLMPLLLPLALSFLFKSESGALDDPGVALQP
jgi:hypothetical protein